MLHLDAAAETATRATGLPDSASDYTCLFRVRFNSLPGSGDYFTPFVLRNTLYTKFIGIFTDFERNAIVLQVGDGTTTVETPHRFLHLDHWSAVAYVRSGNEHRLYVNGYFVGSCTLDMSAVVFDELLVGDDGFGTPDFDMVGFREFESALVSTVNPAQRAFALISEWNTSAAVLPLPLSDCSLLTDENDATANGNDFLLTGATIDMTAPTTWPLVTDWAEVTAAQCGRLLFFPNDRHTIMYFTVGVVGAVALIYRFISQNTTTIGGVSTLNSYSFAIDCYYKSTNWVLLGTVTDPWPNPTVGIPRGETEFYPPGSFEIHRFAMSMRSSTVDISTLTSYEADGEVHVYLDDVEQITGTTLTIRTPEPSFGVGFGFDTSSVLDRITLQRFLQTPNTDSEGLPLDPDIDDEHNYITYDDFGTSITTINPWVEFSAVESHGVISVINSPVYPFYKADVGGNAGAGLSSIDLTYFQAGNIHTTDRRPNSGLFLFKQPMMFSVEGTIVLPPNPAVEVSREVSRQWRLLRFDMKPRKEETA